ncbi:hypothetical protein [Pedosphaera parvula]|nr:hypothetical protein [Pedosphaera parvula]
MKNSSLPSLLLCLSLFSVSIQAAPPQVKLTGIINMPDYKSALLEITDTIDHTETTILTEGQAESFSPKLRLEIIQVNPVKRTAKLNLTANQTNSIITLALDNETKSSADAPAIQFRNADLNQVLRLYAKFSNRTVLHPPLPSIEMSCNANATNETDAAEALAKALNKNGYTNILDGTKFVMVLRSDRASMAHPRSAEIKSSAPAPDPPSTRTNIIPAGEINFPGVDPYQVAHIYAELIGGRKFDFNTRFPHYVDLIHFVSQTPLSKEEVIYALDTLFAWQNIKLIPIGKDLVQAVEIKPE